MSHSLAKWAAWICALPGFLNASYYLHWLDHNLWFYEWRALNGSEWAGIGLGFWLIMVMRSWVLGRTIVVSIGLLLMFIPFLKPVLAPVDLAQLKDLCVGPFCLQSSPSTCGPASAATLLRLRGLKVTERELAQESHTSQTGTELWYLARAIRQRGVPVQFVQMTSPGRPGIAGVILPGGSGHFVAILNRTTVFDPLVGLRRPEDYRFTGMLLALGQNFGYDAGWELIR